MGSQNDGKDGSFQIFRGSKSLTLLSVIPVDCQDSSAIIRLCSTFFRNVVEKPIITSLPSPGKIANLLGLKF